MRASQAFRAGYIWLSGAPVDSTAHATNTSVGIGGGSPTQPNSKKVNSTLRYFTLTSTILNPLIGSLVRYASIWCHGSLMHSVTITFFGSLFHYTSITCLGSLSLTRFYPTLRLAHHTRFYRYSRLAPSLCFYHHCGSLPS